MTWPAGISTCTVTGKFLDGAGNGMSGTITFTYPGFALVDAADKVIVAAGTVTATLVGGAFSVVLPFTDNAAVQPSGWSYMVTEQISYGRSYFIQLPTSTGPTVDISSLVPASGTSTPVWANAPFVPLSAYTAKGDLVAATAAGTVARVGVGADGTALVADSTQTAGMHWTVVATKPAWQFDVTAAAYGAKGDGQAAVDGAMTATSTALACTTSTPFKSSDVGKLVMVKGAAANGVTTLVTTIAGFTDSGHVTLAAAAATTVSGALVMWATDDTTAIQSAINAATAYATAASGNGYGQVFIPPAPAGKFYGIGGALVNGGATHGNGQLTLPVVATTGTKLVLDITGAPNGAPVRHWQETIPNCSGSTLVSFGVFASIGAQTTSLNANGAAAVITGPSGAAGYGTSASLFSNIQPCLRNLNIITTHSTFGLGYGGYSFHGCANSFVENVTIGTAGTAAAGDFNNPVTFANGLSIGAIQPASGNNDSCQVRNLVIMGGYTFGLYATEHTDVHGGTILYCWAGYCPVGAYGDGGSASGALHATHATMLSLEGNTWPVALIGAGAAGIGPQIHAVLDTEQVLRQFRDQSSGTALGAAVGEIRLCGDNNAISTANPTGLVIIDDTRLPGPASPIALTLGAAVQNTYWRRAKVTLAGGTLTAVKVSQLMGGGSAPTMTTVYSQASGALPLMTVPVGPGAWIEVDGSVLPTTNSWVLE